MPTYQYVCTECGQDLEAVQSFSDAALTECPACAGRLRKKFGSVGVVFKGSGFYRNDSRSGNGSSATAASSADKGESKSESKSDSSSTSTSTEKSGGDKPAAKKDSKPSGSTSTTTTAA